MLVGTGQLPKFGGDSDMRKKLLRAKLVNLKRVLADTELESVHDQRLPKILRELDALSKGGSVRLRRVERFVGLVADLLCEELIRRDAEGRK
jgi:hypothetical protein